MKKRQALVVGINEYPFGDSLSTAAEDAEKIAKLLETSGSFEVHRLPCKEGLREVDSEKQLNLKELEDAITQLFQPKSGIIPETALLFFAGHGLQRERDGETEGFLITSETRQGKDKGLFSLKRLRQLLQNSPVRQQIVWLDCCNSGELFNFLEQDLAEFEQQRDFDRCFIAACREFQIAYGRVLTPALLKALDPTNKEKDRVTNLTLKPLLEAALQNAPQHSVIRNTGSQIILTHKGGVRGNICPYKGLDYFDFNPTKHQEAEDHRYFYGRTQLTNQLLGKVASGNFLAVIGASGSGKSSVVRAGLLYQLYLGNQSPLENKLPGSDRWTFYPPFTPGTDPLGNLQQVLGINFKTADDLVNFIERTPSERVVLVVDQFEEVFAPPNKDKRQDFFECLIGAVERLGNKLCLVLVMRDDFQHKCAEQDYAGLAKKIDNNLVRVQRMNRQELQEVILKPAERVELEIDGDLVEQMIADVSDSPGDLALLQYTLTQLWENSSLNLLTISDYSRLGGVQKALGNYADTVYNSLLPEEQKAARRIFLELTRLSEDENTPNTRQQVWQKDLVNSQQSEELVNNVVKCLSDVKLVVTSEQELEGQRVAVVNVVHETLIRNWGLLGGWLKESREALIIKQQIEDAAKEWRNNGKPEELDYLLQGSKLSKAENFIQSQADFLSLSYLTQKFIKTSREIYESRVRQEQEQTDALDRAVTESSLRAQAATVSNFLSAQPVKNLVFAIKLVGENIDKLNDQVISQVQASLHKAIELAREKNIFSGHTYVVSTVACSPDGKYIVSGGWDKTVRLWDVNGNAIGNPFLGHKDDVNAVAFSPNSLYIVSGSKDKSVRLWNINGQPIGNPFVGHEAGVTSVAFSPDGQYIVSSCRNWTVRLWNFQGESVGQPFEGHEDVVFSVAFNPNGQYIASSGSDKTIRLWDLQGKTIRDPFQGHENTVGSIAFSPDGNFIISGSHDNTLRLWDIQGRMIGSPFKGHEGGVYSVAFSPDGQCIASGSFDGTVRLWDIKGNLLGTALRGHTESVYSVAFSPNGQFIVSGGFDSTIRLWNRYGHQIGDPFQGHEGAVYSVAFSPNSELIASGSKDSTPPSIALHGTLALFNADSPNSLSRLTKAIVEVATEKNKNLEQADVIDVQPKVEQTEQNLPIQSPEPLLSSSEIDASLQPEFVFLNDKNNETNLPGEQPSVVKLRAALEDLRQKNSLPTANPQVIAAAIDQLKSFASPHFGEGGTVRLWNIQGESISEPFQKHGDTLSAIAFSPDGQYIVSASRDKTLQLWNIQGCPVGEFFQGHESAVNSVAFSPDSKWIVSGGFDKTVRLWDYQGNPIGNPFCGHNGSVKSVTFSPDSQLIISCGEDRTIRLWDILGHQIGNPFEGHESPVYSVAFSPDGQHIVSGSEDRSVRLWNKQGQLVHIPFRGHEDIVTSVAFSPDGQCIASASHDRTIRLWDLQGNSIGEPLRGHHSYIWSVAFSRDGQYIATGSQDSTVRLWLGGNWKTWLKVACERLRYHPVFVDPTTEEAKVACEVCQQYIWGNIAY